MYIKNKKNAVNFSSSLLESEIDKFCSEECVLGELVPDEENTDRIAHVRAYTGNKYILL